MCRRAGTGCSGRRIRACAGGNLQEAEHEQDGASTGKKSVQGQDGARSEVEEKACGLENKPDSDALVLMHHA
jgi:hypothetical protein